MPAYAVLRIEKLKTWGDIAALDAHNARKRETPNADPDRLQENRILIGDPEKDIPTAVKEAIGDQNIRKNAVLAVEMLISASPEYFRPNNPASAGEFENEQLDAWAKSTTEWLKDRYGDRVVKAQMHLDEATPHIHAVMVPLDDRGKLNCRSHFGGTRKPY